MAPNSVQGLNGPNFNIVFLQDEHGRVYAIVTDKDYPNRIAGGALRELMELFSKELGQKSGYATENSLSKASRAIFEYIISKYEQPNDKLYTINSKVEVLKANMKENIRQALENTITMERVEDQSNQLNEQALQFKKGATQLKDQMCWQKWRNYLVIGGLLTVVLIIIIVPLAVSSNSSKK